MKRMIKTVAIINLALFVSWMGMPAFAEHENWNRGDQKRWEKSEKKNYKHYKKAKKKAHKKYKKAQKKAYKDWRDDIREIQSRNYNCNLPPGLAKKGKVPPGWQKKCSGRYRHDHDHDHRHVQRDDHDHYPPPPPTRQPRRDGPTGSVDLGVGVDIHIPFLNDQRR